MAKHNQGLRNPRSGSFRIDPLTVNGDEFTRTDRSVCGIDGCTRCNKSIRIKEIHQTIQGWIIGLSGSAVVLTLLGVITNQINW